MEGFDDFERFAKLRGKWLRKWLRLPHGTPSDDTFRRIFTAPGPKAFMACFVSHVRSIRPDLADELVALSAAP